MLTWIPLACLASRNLNCSNRPMRTRMPGGVGGDWPVTGRPYPDLAARVRHSCRVPPGRRCAVRVYPLRTALYLTLFFPWSIDYPAALFHAEAGKPGQHALPAVLRRGGMIARAIVGIKRMAGIGIHHDLRFRVGGAQRLAHRINRLQRNTAVLCAV
ncbi:hypothetical protein SG0093 [Sodalis glossinidius str. 'morsitans']|uniref:Uncharacterized protein n=1 Tax=Sodalis glossinidius (strain morsitans) TaxID=343509 RepID=Q2NWV7_SODGM|nr:hypothetical protein SG0093 [Sodalis glossinidius str. 'morsitans']